MSERNSYSIAVLANTLRRTSKTMPPSITHAYAISHPKRSKSPAKVRRVQLLSSSPNGTLTRVTSKSSICLQRTTGSDVVESMEMMADDIWTTGMA